MAGPVAPVARQRLAALPVAPREYHDFYRSPRFRWWHSLVALGVLVVGWGAAVLAATTAAVVYEMSFGRATLEEMAQGLVTPALFLANNVGVALVIPVAVVAHRVVFGQRAGWLFSIHGRLRWGLLGRFLLAAGVVHLVVLVGWLGADGVPAGLRIRPESWFLLAVILLTTPLQAAGEEVAFRGLAARAVGSWFDAPRVGLVVSTVVTASAFMLVHGAGDVWLNVWYLCIALAASLLTWRAGGLEAAFALHVVANLTTMLFLPFLGLDDVFDRGPGSGGAQAVAQAAAVLLTTVVLLLQARRLGLPVSAEPAEQAD
jgi:membrane protease YdiL (CAAX protease family)